MRALIPFIKMFRYAWIYLLLGLLLMFLGLMASISLLTLSGWFLAATALSGSITFNFFYPSSGVRGLAIARTATRYVERLVTHDATFRLIAKLRLTVFARLIPLTPSGLTRYRNSDLLNRLVADVDSLDSLYLRLIAPFISGLLAVIVLYVGIGFIDRTLALILASSLLVLLFVIPISFYWLGRSFAQALTLAKSDYRVRFVDWMQNQAELLLFNIEASQRQQIDTQEQQWQQLQTRESKLTGFSAALLLLGNGLLLLSILWIAGNTDFLSQSELRLAHIALVTFATLASFELLMPLGGAFLRLGQVVSAAQRVNEITTQQPSVQFKSDDLPLAAQANGDLIELTNVSFHYPESDIDVLKQVNLTIHTGQKVAILGKTGSGKSSLLQLLIRHYDPSAGQIYLGQHTLSDYSEASLRSHICYLSQRVYIFSATLRDNLLIANPNSSDAELQQVLHRVGLAHLLDDELGLAQWLGDGGRPLSGGEQRRLGLCRVFLSESPVVLLDEPTEGLDRETERSILQQLLQHCADKTMVMITHRLTALEQFDQIVVIDVGYVCEQGDYQQLSQNKTGLFYRFMHRLSL